MKYFKKLTISSVILTLLFAIPALLILSNIFLDTPNWQHIQDTVLSEYIFNSLYIMFGVAILTSCIGFSTAYITTMYSFTFSKFYHYALILPFAIPTYIVSYVYAGMFDMTGSITLFILDILGYENVTEVFFLDIMSIEGAIIVMSLVLYPYVYLISKTYLISESSSIIDASKTMGLSPWQTFTKVIIPVSRPAIVAGTILAVMEAVADFGVVDYYGVPTFVTGIFRTWYGMGSVEDASKLASMLMLFIFLLIFLEKFQRRNKRYNSSGKDYSPISKIKLRGKNNFFASLLCFLPVFFGFILPITQMSYWFILSYEDILDEDFLEILFQTVSLGLVGSILITFLGFIFVYNVRVHKNKISDNLTQIVKLGYSIPGAVVAVGVLGFFAIIDQSFDILLSGSILAIIFAYCVRFLAISINNYESGFTKIPQSYDDACITMHISENKKLKKVILPLIKNSIMASFIIVFIEIIKELPLTMILRPFNFDTLAVYSHELVGQAQVYESSVPAMFIVGLGIISVLLLAQKMIKE